VVVALVVARVAVVWVVWVVESEGMVEYSAAHAVADMVVEPRVADAEVGEAEEAAAVRTVVVRVGHKQNVPTAHHGSTAIEEKR
jgi:hypothetical protein